MRVVRSYCIILRPTNASLALVYVRWDVKNNTWMLSEILRTLIVNIDYQVRHLYCAIQLHFKTAGELTIVSIFLKVMFWVQQSFFRLQG